MVAAADEQAALGSLAVGGAGDVRSAVPLRGLLAAEEVMLPYFARSMKAAFPASKSAIDTYLDQLRLADKAPRLRGFAGKARLVDEDGWELRLSERREAQRDEDTM